MTKGYVTVFKDCTNCRKRFSQEVPLGGAAVDYCKACTAKGKK